MIFNRPTVLPLLLVISAGVHCAFGEEIFRKAVPKVGDIVIQREVVTKDPSNAKDLLSRLSEEWASSKPLSIIQLTLQLERKDGGSITLATKVQTEFENIAAGFIPLDAYCDAGDIVVPALVGTEVGAWCIHAGPMVCDSWVKLDRWQLAALSKVLDASSVKVTVERMSDKRIAIEVTDLQVKPEDRQAARYEQVPDVDAPPYARHDGVVPGIFWQFKLTKKPAMIPPRSGGRGRGAPATQPN